MKSGLQLKAMATKLTEINIIFRRPPLMLFEEIGNKVPHSNVLTLRIQPDEGIRLSFDAKRPGPTVLMERVAMDFSYREKFGTQPSADAYERLLLDVILGDTTLFIRRDEVELAWDRITRILEGWQMQENEAKEQGKVLKLPPGVPKRQMSYLQKTVATGATQPLCGLRARPH